MARFECGVCGYIYDEDHASRKFEELTECPICGTPKSSFKTPEKENEENDVPVFKIGSDAEEETTENKSEFVVEKRQEFWSPLGAKTEEKSAEAPKPTWTISGMGTVQKVIDSDNPEEVKTENVVKTPEKKSDSPIQTFYSEGNSVKSPEEIEREKEQNEPKDSFRPLWGSGTGTIQTVINPSEKNDEEQQDDDNDDFVFEEIGKKNDEPFEEVEEGGRTIEPADVVSVESLVEETFFNDSEDDDEIENMSEFVEILDDEEPEETKVEETADTTVEETADTTDEVDEVIEETAEAAKEEAEEDNVVDEVLFGKDDEEAEETPEASAEDLASEDDFVFEEATEEETSEEESPIEEVAEETAEEETFTFEEAPAEEAAEEETFTFEEAPAEEAAEEETFTFEEAPAEEATEEETFTFEEAPAEEATEDETYTYDATPVEEAVEEAPAQEFVFAEAPAEEVAEDIVEEAAEPEAVAETIEEVAETTEEAAETTEEAAETTEEAVVDTVEEVEQEAEDETVDASEDDECIQVPVAYSMLKGSMKYSVLYDEQAKKIFDNFPVMEERVSNGLENIILMPAQLNPLPLPGNTEVETRTVLGALTACPVEVRQPFCFSKLFLWGEHIPNNDEPEEYNNQAFVLVKGKNGHIPEVASREELKEEVAIARERFHGTPVGVDLVAGRIESDLASCVYAKVDFVILNDLSSRILPYALRRAKNFLNKVNAKIDILVCVDALKDAQELAKIIALGADFVLVERGFDLDMAARITEDLKEIARSTGHDNVHDINMNDICTVDGDIAAYTDIAHI